LAGQACTDVAWVAVLTTSRVSDAAAVSGGNVKASAAYADGPDRPPCKSNPFDGTSGGSGG
jgi:hypothetical protein